MENQKIVNFKIIEMSKNVVHYNMIIETPFGDQIKSSMKLKFSDGVVEMLPHDFETGEFKNISWVNDASDILDTEIGEHLKNNGFLCD